MPKLTQAQAIVNALLKRGYTEETSATRKYRAFRRLAEPHTFMFVGKSGAVRRGRNITTSISLERTQLRRDLLKEGGYARS